MDMMQCQNLSVPMDVMHHVVQVESSANPYAIGVVGGKLVRQPRTLEEAVATAEMLERRGYNFSLGLAQVNRYNLQKYGIASYNQAFDGCTSLRAGSRILSECHARANGDWGSAFSCYYSGNFTTGYRHGYVQKIFASMAGNRLVPASSAAAIPLAAVAVSPATARLSARRVVDGDQAQDLAISAMQPGTIAPTPPEPASLLDAATVDQTAVAKPGVDRSVSPVSTNEGVVRLTRNGPVYPSGNVAAALSQAPKPEKVTNVSELQEPVKIGDNAFVF
ncbi:lytic transglycosylase domain-containing protein [Pseudoxanthomonas sp.]|uniref:lytic transglycosylase domain-containing protein n=1 Tax=Pseudoxanthomonas sp. TaxID=1871049 RepID=UPI0031F2E76E